MKIKAKVLKVDLSREDVARAIAKRNKYNVTAQQWLTGVVIKHSDPFVPMDTGMLASSVIRASDYDKGLIVYDEPYARLMYYGVPTRRKKNPGDFDDAGSLWIGRYGTKFNYSRDKHPQARSRWFEAAKAMYLEIWGRGVAKIMGGTWKQGSVKI